MLFAFEFFHDISIRVGKSREEVESLELYAISNLWLLFHQEAQEADVEMRRNQDAASFCIFIGAFFSNSRMRPYDTGNLIFVAASSLRLERTAG